MGQPITLRQQGKQPAGTRHYANGNKQRKKLVQWMSEQVAVSPGHTILEIGCGNGQAIARFARQAGTGTVYGIEPSASLYEACYRRCRSFIKQNRVKISRQAIEDTRFPGRSFQLVYALNPPVFPQQSFVHIRQWLKPGGRLVLVFQPWPAYTESQLINLAGLLQQQLDQAGFLSTHRKLCTGNPTPSLYIECFNA